MCGAAKGVSGHFMEVAELESILDKESILLQELVIMGEESIFLLKSSRVENGKTGFLVIWFLFHVAISSRYDLHSFTGDIFVNFHHPSYCSLFF